MIKILESKLIKDNFYQVITSSDESMSTLSLFFEDGLPSKNYVEFLKNNTKKSLSGNIIRLKKIDNNVILTFDDYIFPEACSFELSIENMIFMIEEYDKYEQIKAEHIKITIDNDKVTIKGE